MSDAKKTTWTDIPEDGTKNNIVCDGADGLAKNARFVGNGHYVKSNGSERITLMVALPLTDEVRAALKGGEDVTVNLHERPECPVFNAEMGTTAAHGDFSLKLRKSGIVKAFLALSNDDRRAAKQLSVRVIPSNRGGYIAYPVSVSPDEPFKPGPSIQEEADAAQALENLL